MKLKKEEIQQINLHKEKAVVSKKHFLTTAEKSKIKNGFDKMLHPFIYEITSIKDENVKENFEKVRAVPNIEDEELLAMFKQPILPKTMKKIIEAHLAYCTSFVDEHYDKNSIQNFVERIEAIKNNKDITKEGLLNAANWALLHALNKYISLPKKDFSFRSYSYFYITPFILKYIANQKSSYLLGSFLSQKMENEYYKNKLRDLITNQ